MFKKLIISITCVGFMSLLVGEALAAWPTTSGTGWGWTNSINCLSLWKSLGNTDNNPTLIECVILPVTIEAQCMNPADNIGGGVVFNLWGNEVSDGEVVYPYQLDARGRYESSLIISDIEIFEGMDLGSSEICDAFNNGASTWDVAPPPEGYIHVIRMFAAFKAWVDEDGIDTDGDGGLEFETLVENVQAACKAPEDADFDVPGVYDCEVQCDQTRKFVCPASLTYYYDTLCKSPDEVDCDNYFDF